MGSSARLPPQLATWLYFTCPVVHYHGCSHTWVLPSHANDFIMSAKQFEEAMSVVCDLLTYEIILKFKPKRRRKVWVCEWIKRWGVLGTSSALCCEHRDEDEHGDINLYRLNRNQYMWLLDKLQMQIQKRDWNMQKAVPPETKLDITLRFLASGESYTSIQYLLKVPKKFNQ
jgi:hypothetical protein